MANVLLVDDDVDLVTMNRAVLAHRGHEVRAAYSAEEARRVLDGFEPDVAVLDVMMESIGAGFELAREIHERRPAVTLVMLTAVHAATDVPFRFEPDADWLPAVKLLDKPVPPADLADEIDRIVKGKRE